MPAATASRGEFILTSLPFMRIVPPWRGSAPHISRAVSVRPAPMSPAKPSISPFFKLKDTPFTSLETSSSASNTIGAPSGTFDCVLGSSYITRPTIICTTWSIVVSAVSTVLTYWPSRITVILSVISFSSFMRCEMYIMPTPVALSRRINTNRSSISLSVSAAEGSSSTSIFVFS